VIVTVDAKRTNIKATPLPDKYDGSGEPGAIAWFIPGQIIVMACPGCGRTSGMEVGNPKPAKSPSWLISGFVDLPETVTLSPSVNCTGCCGWHGWLRDGVYVSC
jgi:hypothetical protein